MSWCWQVSRGDAACYRCRPPGFLLGMVITEVAEQIMENLVGRIWSKRNASSHAMSRWKCGNSFYGVFVRRSQSGKIQVVHAGPGDLRPSQYLYVHVPIPSFLPFCYANNNKPQRSPWYAGLVSLKNVPCVHWARWSRPRVLISKGHFDADPNSFPMQLPHTLILLEMAVC